MRQVKKPQVRTFKPLLDNILNPQYENNMGCYLDCDPADSFKRDIQHLCFNTLSEYMLSKCRIPRAWDQADALEFYAMALKNIQFVLDRIQEKSSTQERELICHIIMFALTCAGIFPPQAAFLGGVVA